MKISFTPRTVDRASHLSVTWADVPPLNAYASVNGEADHNWQANPSQSVPQWVNLTWRPIRAIARRCGILPLIAEVAVIRDLRHPDKEHAHPFVSNIVTPFDQFYERSLIQSYSSTLDSISEHGSSFFDAQFLNSHYVFVEGIASSSPEIQKNWEPASGMRKVIENPSKGIWRENGLSLEGHHVEFFDRFLKAINLPESKIAGIHYLAIPIQRATCDVHAGEIFSISPGAALYLIFSLTDKRRNLNASVESFVSLAREAFDQAILKESSRFLDFQTRREVERNQLIAAYDGIGHALRVFVEATGYRGAINELRAVARSPNLCNVEKQRLNRAQRSLQFFEHAEALGSLMRVHGWAERDKDLLVSYEKILKNFSSEQAERISTGSLDEPITSGISEMCRTLGNQLAYRYNTTFRICKNGAPPETISKETEDYVPISETLVPPLTTAKNEIAILLALSVALIEPMRNSAKYVSENSPKGSERCVYVLVSTHCGTTTIFVGNRIWEGTTFDSTAAVKALSMISELLADLRLGTVRHPTDPETRYISQDQDQGNWLWVAIDLHPYQLYEHIKSNVTGTETA